MILIYLEYRAVYLHLQTAQAGEGPIWDYKNNWFWPSGGYMVRPEYRLQAPIYVEAEEWELEDEMAGTPEPVFIQPGGIISGARTPLARVVGFTRGSLAW